MEKTSHIKVYCLTGEEFIERQVGDGVVEEHSHQIPHQSRLVMFYIYILRSVSDRSLYVGYTPDLRARLIKHNKGYVVSTRNSRPWELTYYEAYKSKNDAVRREKALKLHAKAMTQLKSRLRESLS
jgi:putative endonuclease